MQPLCSIGSVFILFKNAERFALTKQDPAAARMRRGPLLVPWPALNLAACRPSANICKGRTGALGFETTAIATGTKLAIRFNAHVPDMTSHGANLRA